MTGLSADWQRLATAPVLAQGGPGKARPLGASPLPRVLGLAAFKAAGCTRTVTVPTQVWFRAPPLVGVSVMVYIQLYLQTGVSVWVKGVRVFLICLGAWNGLFFMERVVGHSKQALLQQLVPRSQYSSWCSPVQSV